MPKPTTHTYMKKILMITGSLGLLFLLLLLLLPVFLRNNITDIVEKQADKYLNARLHIESIQLSMFKSFPDLNVSIREITLSGEKEFAGDTLLHVPLFSASVNVMSLLKGNKVIVNRLLLKDALFMPQVAETGHPNWDILFRDSVPSSPAEKSPDTSKKEDSEEIRLNDIRIENLTVDYKDEARHTYARIHRLNLDLSGNFAETQTLLKMELSAQDLSFRQGQIQWVNNTDIRWQSEIAADFREQIFDIQKNALSVNELKLILNGRIGIEKEKYNVDLQLKAPDTRFESLLALVPKEFRNQLDSIQTTGEFTLNATTKGSYYTGHLPRLYAELAIHDASLKYPNLPESVNHINLALKIHNPGGPIDSTQMDLQQLTFTIADNPFAMNLLLTNPVYPSLQGNAKGNIDFASLKKALPLKDISIEGNLYTDLTFNGKYKDIEKKEYEKLKAQGEITMNQIVIRNTTFPQGIFIPSGKLNVTPTTLKINEVKARILSSALTLNGTLSNYLPYLLKKQTLKGNFSLTSPLINLNELMRTNKKTASSTDTISDPDEPCMPELPANLDLRLQTDIQKLLFDQLTIQHLKGNLQIANAKATFSDISMNLLNGSLRMNGDYGTSRPRIPHFNLNLNISGADIHSAYKSFSFIRQSLPIAMNCEGRISADCKLASDLTSNGTLNLKTTNGSGYISSQNILINQNPTMQKLASTLNNEELNRISISALKIEFEIQKGNLTVKPFKTMLAGNPATIYGYQSAEGNIAYNLSLNVKRKYFGKDIENVLKSIPGSHNIENLDLDVRIEGTLSKPEVKPDLSKALKTIQKEAEKELRKKAQKGLMKELNKLFR